jgi:CRISPR-associated protein Cst2
MLKSFNLTARLTVNVHDMNNEATSGNVSDIRMMDYIDLDGQRREAPAVSGRMLKHWHLDNAVRLGMDSGLPVCDVCRQGEPLRPDESIRKKDPAKECFICDAHGYLVAEKETIKRNSRVFFSWFMPTLEPENAVTFKQVIHNRVTSDPKKMMPFNKSYASARYAFVSGLDCDRIGYQEIKMESVIDETEKNNRIKALIEAYRYLLTGKVGASQSHALAHMDIREVMTVISEKTILPYPVSAIYPDYAKKTIGIMPENAEILGFGQKEQSEKMQNFESLNDLFSHILERLK